MKIKNNGSIFLRAHAPNLLKFVNLENTQRALLLSSASHLSRPELSDNFYERKTYIKYNKLLRKMRNLLEYIKKTVCILYKPKYIFFHR